MAIQYYMRGYNTAAPGAVGFVDWVVNDQPDNTAAFIQAPFLPSNITNITVNRIVTSKVDNWLQPDQGYISADGYFFHLNSFDQLHASTPTATVIPPPSSLVGIAVTRGGTTNSQGLLLPGASTNFFATMLWNESQQRWMFIRNTNGDHVTLGNYLPVNTGDLTIDGYLAVGTLPALSQTIRIPNGAWIAARRANQTPDGYLIRLDNFDRVQLGTLADNPSVYVPGNLRIDGYIRDGGASPALTGFIRNSNHTTIVTFRNTLDNNNITALSSAAIDTFNNAVVLGDSVNSSVTLNTATAAAGTNGASGVHKFQVNGTTLVEIGSPISSPVGIRFTNANPGANTPIISQTSTTVGNGQTMTVQAQTTTQSGQQGGVLVLSAGDGAGAGAHGSVQIRAGSATPKITVFPTIAASAGDNNSVLFNENLLRFALNELNPVIRQDTDTTGTGDILTLQAQNITTGTGGELRVTSGTGTATVNAGFVNVQTGGVNRITVTPGATSVTGTTIYNFNIEEFSPTVPNPLIRQALAASGTGQILTLQAQNITTGTGGNLVLTSGTGTAAANAGTVDIQTGAVSRMLITTPFSATTATAAININSFEFIGGGTTTVPNPTWTQRNKTATGGSNGINGETMTIQAQTSTVASSIGGDLVLGAGDGVTRDGYVRIQTGLVDRLAVTQTQTVVYGDLLVLGTSTTVNSTVVDLADRVIHVNSSAASYPTPTPAPTQITGFSVDRGTVGGPAKRDYYGLFWYEPDGYWRFAANTDGYAPGLEQTLAQTLPVISSTYLAQPLSATVTATIPTVGGFRSLNNTVHSASRNAGGTADLILVSTNSSNNLIWGAATDNAGHIFRTTVGTMYDFRAADISTYRIIPVSSGTTTLEATDTITSLIYRQANTAGATGANTTVQAQNAVTTGGNLVLTSGTGVTAGNVQLQTGAVDRVVVRPTFTEFRDASEAIRITPVSAGTTQITFASTVTAAQINQTTTIAATGATMTVAAQTATTTGGSLFLTAGTGATTDGYVALQVGGSTTASARTNKFQFNKGWRRNITTVTGALTVVDGYDYLAVTALAAPYTITLPATPTTGDTYTVKDTTGDAATNNLTISGNGNNIDGAASFVLSQPYAAATFTYTGSQWSVT